MKETFITYSLLNYPCNIDYRYTDFVFRKTFCIRLWMKIKKRKQLLLENYDIFYYLLYFTCIFFIKIGSKLKEWDR